MEIGKVLCTRDRDPGYCEDTGPGPDTEAVVEACPFWFIFMN